MNRFASRMRRFFTYFLSVLLTLCLLGSILCLSVLLCCSKDAVFSASSARHVVFSSVLAGEDPALISQLEQIDAFTAAQDRYTADLFAWRYQGGASWAGLKEEEAADISYMLLKGALQNTQAQHPLSQLSEHADYEKTLTLMSASLQGALQNVFPPFENVLDTALRLKMDFAAACLCPQAFLICLLCAAVSFGFLLLCMQDRAALKQQLCRIALSIGCAGVLASGLFFQYRLPARLFPISALLAPALPSAALPVLLRSAAVIVFAALYLLRAKKQAPESADAPIGTDVRESQSQETTAETAEAAESNAEPDVTPAPADEKLAQETPVSAEESAAPVTAEEIVLLSDTADIADPPAFDPELEKLFAQTASFDENAMPSNGEIVFDAQLEELFAQASEWAKEAGNVNK